MSKPSKSRKVISHKAAGCVGCAYCAEVLPQYFRLDDDGMAILLNSTRTGAIHRAEALAIDLSEIQDAVDGCATNIISVDDS